MSLVAKRNSPKNKKKGADDGDAKFMRAARFGRVKNDLKMGFVGLPNVGKSTLAGALISQYRQAGKTIGVIAVDAIFTPVRKVNYWVESMRVGQMTNYDKLTIEIETDGEREQEAMNALHALIEGKFGEGE